MQSLYLARESMQGNEDLDVINLFKRDQEVFGNLYLNALYSC
jgi:hypothetical protein